MSNPRLWANRIWDLSRLEKTKKELRFLEDLKEKILQSDMITSDNYEGRDDDILDFIDRMEDLPPKDKPGSEVYEKLKKELSGLILKRTSYYQDLAIKHLERAKKRVKSNIEDLLKAIPDKQKLYHNTSLNKLSPFDSSKSPSYFKNIRSLRIPNIPTTITSLPVLAAGCFFDPVN